MSWHSFEAFTFWVKGFNMYDLPFVRHFASFGELGATLHAVKMDRVQIRADMMRRTVAERAKITEMMRTILGGL